MHSYYVKSTTTPIPSAYYCAIVVHPYYGIRLPQSTKRRYEVEEATPRTTSVSQLSRASIGREEH